MSLTRKFLQGMGLSDEQVDSIVEMHTDTTDALKEEIKKYKESAEKLPAVQKELDDLKAKGDDGWKEKHDAVKKEFDDFKQAQTDKETKAAKEKAARAYFESKNIEGANLNIAMRSSAAEIDALELDGEKIKDSASLDALRPLASTRPFAGLPSASRTQTRLLELVASLYRTYRRLFPVFVISIS